MFRLKGCGRCGGDLWFQRDVDAHGWRCLQCGRSSLAPVPLARGRRTWTDRVFGVRSGVVRKAG